MKIKIDERGHLHLERSPGFVKAQWCPYSAGDWKECGDWCPSFQVAEPFLEGQQDLVTIYICRGYPITGPRADFEDLRS